MTTLSLADLILHNGNIATMDTANPRVSAVAISGGRVLAVGTDADIFKLKGERTKLIDLGQRTVIPGLNDTHIHTIRGGLNYNMELRWDGVPSLADAMRMLKDQAARTPAPQWVRVVGSFSEFQFAERRLPTLDELNEAAPETPVFILHLYCQALLNRAALRACGYTRDTPNPPGGEIQRDKSGNPTGLLIAKPNANLLYSALAKGPKLPPEYQANSTRQFLRELNRLGLTSCIDAGGGFQNYPDDYAIFTELHKRGEVTVRTAYNLFTQKPKHEMDDFARWMRMTKPGEGDDFYRVNGAGEMLTFSAADFEDFMEPRPDLDQNLERELKEVVTALASNNWPFRLHATYDESITRFLNIFEEVHRDVPLNNLHWLLDHCEAISDRNLERVKALGGGIAIQHRMAFQGEHFVRRYGAAAAKRTPPVRRMLEMGIPVAAGTDATRVANYNPWNSLYWLVSGKTLGGLSLYPENNCLTREEALRLYTAAGPWFTREEGKKGMIKSGQLADCCVLSEDYFNVPVESIKHIESVLTIVDGKPVYGAGEFEELAPPAIVVLPDWSPVAKYGGYQNPPVTSHTQTTLHTFSHDHAKDCGHSAALNPWDGGGLFGSGCECFAF